MCVCVGGGPVHFYNSIKSALRISHLCFNLISIHLAMPATQTGRYTTQALRSFLKQCIRYGQLIWPVWGVNPAFFGRGPSFCIFPTPSNACCLCSVTHISSTSLFHLLPHMGTIAQNTCLPLIFCQKNKINHLLRGQFVKSYFRRLFFLSIFFSHTVEVKWLFLSNPQLQSSVMRHATFIFNPSHIKAGKNFPHEGRTLKSTLTVALSHSNGNNSSNLSAME